jgi:hypothetical protein
LGQQSEMVTTMPLKSKAQMRFMYGVAGGSIKAKGLSKAEATKMIKETSKKQMKRLPARKKRGR